MHSGNPDNPVLHRGRQRFYVVMFVGVVYWLTGILTWSYPPEYLSGGKIWATAFVVAGWLAWMTLVHPAVWLATLSGGLLVGSALFRSAAIFTELGWTRFWRAMLTTKEPPLSSSFAIAGLTWTLIAVLIWVGWPQIQAGIIRSKDEQ